MCFSKVTFVKILIKQEKISMKTVMKKLITIKSISVLALVLLVVLGPSFVKVTAQDPEPGPVYLADDIVTDSIVKKLHGTISLYLTEEKVDVEADIAAIEDIGNQYILAMNTGDLDLYVSLHADDIVKMPPDAPATFGKEELRASTKPLFDNFTIEGAAYREETQVSGDWGFTRCTYTFSMTPKAGGEPLYMDGKALSICKRQADGSWKFSHDCFNSNLPPAQ
jgi:ketosteroid isomerase-like protein